MKFDQKLQSLRKSSGLSQEQLADKLNVSRQAVSKWEMGASYPEMDKLIAMTKIFKCSLDDLTNDTATDKMIIERKNKFMNVYIDSFLEFITKSVNMFCSMKLSSLIKTFIELGIMALILFSVIMLLGTVAKSLIFNILPYGRVMNYIEYFLSDVVFGLLFALGVIIYFQIYKVRYLDYYDKLIYEYEQKKEYKTEEEKVQPKKASRFFNAKEKETIIIRDPSHRPFAFLEPVAKIIIAFIKGGVIIFSLPFCLSWVLLIMSFIICLFLIFYNRLFLALSLCFIAGIVVNYQILEVVYDYVFKKKINISRHFLLFTVSLIILGVGAGLSGILLTNFTFIYDEPTRSEKYEQELAMHDNLYIGYYGDYFDYIIDDRDNVQISVLYHNDFNEVNIDIVDNLITEDVSNKFNLHNISENILNDLKHNIIRSYDNQGITKVRISANQENIATLLKNLSKHYRLYIQNIQGGYRIYLDRLIEDSSNCTLNRNNLYDCIEVKKDFRCSYEIIGGEVIPSDNCECTRTEKDRYYCRYGE